MCKSCHNFIYGCICWSLSGKLNIEPLFVFITWLCTMKQCFIVPLGTFLPASENSCHHLWYICCLYFYYFIDRCIFLNQQSPWSWCNLAQFPMDKDCLLIRLCSIRDQHWWCFERLLLTSTQRNQSLLFFLLELCALSSFIFIGLLENHSCTLLRNYSACCTTLEGQHEDIYNSALWVCGCVCVCVHACEIYTKLMFTVKVRVFFLHHGQSSQACYEKILASC